MNNNFRIGVFTSTRADFGIMSELLVQIEKNSDLQLHVFATGTHLLDEFGATIDEIESFSFTNVHAFPLGYGESKQNQTPAIAAQVLTGVSEFLIETNSQRCIILGDRYEAPSAAFAAQLNKVAIAHIHGGEITQGAMDDAFRHSISKMATLHYPATERYRKRLLQMGEREDRVFNIGSLSLAQIKNMALMSKQDIESSLQWTFKKRNILVTLHPETLSSQPQSLLSNVFFEAISALNDVGIIITYPNTDEGYEDILAAIELVEEKKDINVCVIPSLGLKRYFSCLQYVDLVVGNSSSGVIEAASFGVRAIDVGNRQLGRERAKSVFNVGFDRDKISHLINRLLSDSELNHAAYEIKNPYECPGEVGVSTIISTIRDYLSKPHSMHKTFVDRELK